MKRLLFFFTFICFPCFCLAQFIVSGRVLNQADTRPVANVSVFVNNATIGGKTAPDGTFALKNVKPGKYELIISIVGFDRYRQVIMVTDKNLAIPDILITPAVIGLHEVTVKPDGHRERNLDWFKDALIGAPAGDDCKIINPEVINLDYDENKHILTASSTDFIEIENKLLGYRIKYLLTQFTLNNKSETAREIHFEGSALFAELGGSPAAMLRWQKERERVYQNSPMHFLRAALGNQLASEGFRVLQISGYQNPERPADSIVKAMVSKYEKLKSQSPAYRDSLKFWSAKLKLEKVLEKKELYPLTQKDLVYPTDIPNVWALSCGLNKLQVDYNKSGRFSAKGIANAESTTLTFNDPYVLFSANGIITNSSSVSFSGAWAKNRIAELLPVDFEPADASKPIVQASNINHGNTDTSNPLPDKLKQVTSASDSLAKKAAVEKIYLQFDRPCYSPNDTLWFKAYLLNAVSLTPSLKSGIINVDVLSGDGALVKQYKFPADSGFTTGWLSIDDKLFPPGAYVLRAYTNWMRNFSDNLFFEQSFRVIDARNKLLMSSTAAFQQDSAKLNVKLMFRSTDSKPYAVKPVQVKVLSGKSVVMGQKIQTGVDGSISREIILPKKAEPMKIIAGIPGSDETITTFLPLNRPELADVQFLPEGGRLVSGLNARVGFKAIGEDGRAVEISGIVTDQDGVKAATFRSAHSGMGSFSMSVAAGKKYKAIVSFPGGGSRVYLLPDPAASGIVLSVNNRFGKDTIDAVITATADIATKHEDYFLICKARDIVYYTAVVNFSAGAHDIKQIPKKAFPTGIVHFILTNNNGEPLNERLAFINHNDNLQIRLNTPAVKAVNDSITLKLKVTDGNGAAVSGNFSLSVTDNRFVNDDPFKENIVTRLLLTADLKGYVEQPAYYLSSTDAQHQQALDNLLLTQGWVNYAANFKNDKYKPETEFMVSGKITNAFNKPLAGTDVLLFSKAPWVIKDTLTGSYGRFTFKNFPHTAFPALLIKAVNKHNKSNNVMVKMDEAAPPQTTGLAMTNNAWSTNMDTTVVTYANAKAAAESESLFGSNGHILKEVTIAAKKIVKDSQNLNGPGNADQVLDEPQLESMNKTTWLDLLTAHVKGFKPGRFDLYHVDDKIAVFVIDGYNLYDVLNTHAFNDITNYLRSHTAEDIKGVEVNSTARNAMSYVMRFYPYSPLGTFAFIEITTRPGHGPNIDNTPGVYLYKPVALSWPKEFYKPKYAASATDKQAPVFRPTVDWEPNIITNENGEAEVSFFPSSPHYNYTVTINGCDDAGNLGACTTVIRKKK